MSERNPTFFEMFSPYHTHLTNQQAHDLLAYLETWVVTGAVLDSAARTIEVDLLCPALPPEDLLAYIERDLAGLYQVNAVRLRPMAPEPATCCQEEVKAEPEPEPMPEPPPEPEPEPQPAPVEPPMSEQERAFRQTEALRQKAMKEAQAAHEA